MKTKRLISGIFSIFIMCCFTLIFIGCNSDDDENINEPTTVNYRVSEKVNTQISGSSIYEDKSIYNYLDNRIIEIIELDKENGVWMEDRKTEFDYQGDWVYSTRFYKDGDNWVEEFMQSLEELKIVNGKVMEIKHTYMTGVYREVFTYNGDKLIKIESFENGELNYKYVCSYNGDTLDEIIDYDYYEGIEELDYKYEFSYTNGNLTEVLGLYYDNGIWINSYKDIYIYSGNKVIQIDDYDYYDDAWVLDDSQYFSYNSLGLLESISEGGEGWSWEEIYTYEEGRGNYKLLNDEASYYNVFNFPTAQRLGNTVESPDTRKINIKRLLFH
jgi:hypothetical protein